MAPHKSEITPVHRPGNGTFSIVAMDPLTMEWGVAVASRIFDCGYLVAWLKAGVGAVATQGQVNARLGPLLLELLAAGRSASEALGEALAADRGAAVRQVGVVDCMGNTATHTGAQTLEWAGHLTAKHVSVQGNVVVGERVIGSMMEAFDKSQGELAERLLSALEAGEMAGGDRRGRQSAALLVTRANGGYDGTDDRLVDIRIADHPEPLMELRRTYDLWKYAFLAPAYLRLSAKEKDGSGAFLARTLALASKALEQQLDKAEIYNNLAWHLALSGELPVEALRIAERAHHLAPEDANIMDTLAEACFSAGERQRAVHYEEEALKREPGNEFFLRQLARFSGDK